jgi:hypothetical protein
VKAKLLKHQVPKPLTTEAGLKQYRIEQTLLSAERRARNAKRTIETFTGLFAISKMKEEHEGGLMNSSMVLDHPRRLEMLQRQRERAAEVARLSLPESTRVDGEPADGEGRTGEPTVLSSPRDGEGRQSTPQSRQSLQPGSPQPGSTEEGPGLADPRLSGGQDPSHQIAHSKLPLPPAETTTKRPKPPSHSPKKNSGGRKAVRFSATTSSGGTTGYSGGRKRLNTVDCSSKMQFRRFVKPGTTGVIK